jgi:hypothetical protein
MSSTDAQTEILNTLSNHKKILKELATTNAMLLETLQLIHQRVEDNGKKQDMWMNVGITKPKQAEKAKKKPVKKTKKTEPVDIPKKKAVKKQDETHTASTEEEEAEAEAEGPVPIGNIKNIMKYFKIRWVEDSSNFDDILEDKQAESLFREKKEEIAGKKSADREKAKISMLYKSLTDPQKKKLRKLMNNERDIANINNDDDVASEPESD